jgi:uncharacterized membrane protein
MNKKVFMAELKRCLKHLPKEDREDALAYYEEYLEEMGVDEEQDVTQQIGTPKDVARGILADCTDKHIDEQKEQGGAKNGAKVIWLIILGICASPVAIPIIMAAVLLLFALLLVLFSIVVAVLITGISLVAAGFLTMVGAMWAVGIPQKLVCGGTGLVALALGILLILAIWKLSEFMVRGVAFIFKKLFLRKKVA